jgi:hypothetical protein
MGEGTGCSAPPEGGYDSVPDRLETMIVRIGIADTDKLVELDVEDVKAFKKAMEKAVADGGVAWFTDSKGRTVGIPPRSVAFVEIEDAEAHPTVGFAPAV